MKDLMDIPHSSRICGPPDSAIIFPNTLKKAISMRKDPSAINTPSYFGVSSCWIWITIFAIAKSYVTAMLVFCASAAISKDLHMVFATTEWFVGDWFIWGRYHIFHVYFKASEIFAFHPGHNGVSLSGVTLNPNTHDMSNFQVFLETDSTSYCFLRGSSSERNSTVFSLVFSCIAEY